MIATIKLDDNLENTLTKLSATLHKKKSEIIKEAINHYAKSVQNSKKSKILKAVEKTKDVDKREFNDFEGVIGDGI